MKTKRVGDIEPGEIFLYKKEGEELRAWIHIGYETNSPNAKACDKDDKDARYVKGESFYSYMGRTKYLRIDMRKHVIG